MADSSGRLALLTITRSLMSVASISFSWPVSGRVAHFAVVTSSEMLAWVSRGRQEAGRQVLCGAMELCIFRQMMGWISQLKMILVACHVTGNEGGVPCRQGQMRVQLEPHMPRQHSSSQSTRQGPNWDLIWTTRRATDASIMDAGHGKQTWGAFYSGQFRLGPSSFSA